MNKKYYILLTPNNILTKIQQVKSMTKQIISLTLDKDVIKALDKKAEDDNRSRSGMANFLLRKSLKLKK